MQRYELIDGTSSKFWEVQCSDANVTVRFGRIGTNGQVQTKVFASAAAAEHERAKLIAEKTKKGYSLVGASSETASIAVTPSAEINKHSAVAPANVQPASTQPSTDPQALAATDSAQATTANTPDSLSWPRGGYQWTDETLLRVAPLRGVHVPPFDAAKVLSDRKPMFDGRRSAYWMGVISMALGTPFSAWTRDEANVQYVETNLATFDRNWWREALLQALCDSNSYVDWILKQGIARHGAAAMCDLGLECAPMAAPLGTYDAALRLLRHALATVDDATYQTALQAAEKMPFLSDAHLHARAYVFALHLPFFEAARHRPSALLLSCGASPEAMAAYWRASKINVGSGLHYGLPVQLKLYGEAALPFLMALFEAADTDFADDLVAHAERLRTPGLLPGLVQHLDGHPVRKALERLADEHGDALLYCAFRQLPKAKSRVAEIWTLRLANAQPKARERALGALTDAERRAFDKVAAPYVGADVDAALLPDILRTPPWLAKSRPAPLPTQAIEIPATQIKLDIAEIDRRKIIRAEDVIRSRDRTRSSALASGTSPERGLLASLNVEPEAIDQILAGRAITKDDVRRRYWGPELSQLLALDRAPAARLWNELEPDNWSAFFDQDVSLALLAELIGADIVPGLLRYCAHRPQSGWRAAEMVDSIDIAHAAVRAWCRTRRARAGALAWIGRYPHTTALAALAVAFGKDVARRDDGQATLRWLLANGQSEHVDAAAAECGAETLAALEQLKATDPVFVLPSKLPKLPVYAAPVAMHRPQLRAGGTLPPAAALHVVMMLAISTPDAQYAGLEAVRSACSQESLAEFAWDLFEAWLAHGAAPSQAWAFQSLAILGNDDTARRLTPLIRKWPGQSAKARAVAGLDILAAIGSDIALMHLNALATRAQFKALQGSAREKIDAIAAARGLSRSQLADRLVPDLDIDDGVLTLDFGPRQFTVAFDESLEPIVRDASGVRLRTLPRVTKADDTELASAASERFKRLKKDAKAIATQQIARLEQSMRRLRRWSAAEFRQFFIEHPVMRHLATRLCWAAFDGKQLRTAFRVAEDFTFADSADSAFDLPESMQVGIAHPLELDDAQRAQFGQIFADYEIAQPFRQLARELYALSEDELAANKVTRFSDRKVGSGSIIGLQSRGWSAGVSLDIGLVSSYELRVTDAVVSAAIEPGIYLNSGDRGAPQRITEVVLRKPGSWGKDGILPLRSLSAIAASEMLRDLDRMAAV